jgi:aminotransferase
VRHLINRRVTEIQISGIRKFSNMVAQYKDAISLTIGQPDFDTPAHIKEAAVAAIGNNRTVYTQNPGLPELRQAASDFLQRKYQLVYDPVSEVIVTIGASQALDIAMRTILDEGCEVILPGPVYPGYEPLIKLCGAVPVYVDTTRNGFKLSAELLREKLTEKTRCVILPYPSNPTGCVMNREELEEIARLLENKEIFVISDEIYSELIYGKPHSSIASFPAMREKTIVINGLSKSHSMTGWRIGFTFAPAYLTEQMVKVHQYNVSCASSISQYAAIEALTNGLDDAEPMKEKYVMRRDYVCDRLTAMGLDVVKPDGAFYIFPSIKPFGIRSFDFATRLLEAQKLAVVPGDAFSPLGEGYIRISYAYSMELLEEGMNRLERFVQSIR